MTATILYCLATLIIGLLLTIAVAETWIYCRPRVADWLRRLKARWINRKFHKRWRRDND